MRYLLAIAMFRFSCWCCSVQWLVGVHFSAPTFTPTIEISKRSDDASYYTIIVLSLNCVFMVYLSFVDFHVLLLTYCILPGQSFSFVFDGSIHGGPN